MKIYFLQNYTFVRFWQMLLSLLYAFQNLDGINGIVNTAFLLKQFNLG